MKDMVLASIITILTISAMIILRNKALVVDWERGLKIYIEDKEEADERQETYPEAEAVFRK